MPCSGMYTRRAGSNDPVFPVPLGLDGERRERRAKEIGVHARPVSPSFCFRVGEYGSVNRRSGAYAWTGCINFGVVGSGPECPCAEEEFGAEVVVVVEEL